MSLDAVLARQAGVITRDQALAAGLPRATIDERVRTRRWVPLHPQVYLTPDHPHDGEVRLRAALLWAGADACVSGSAAAWWFGLLAEPPPTVEVTIGRTRRLRSRAGVTVRRRVVPAPDRAVHRGLAVTERGLTVLETAVELGDAGAEFLDETLRRRMPYADLRAACDRVRGTSGSVAAGDLLTAAAARSRSAARNELHRRLRSSGASGWTDGAEVGGSSVDAAFPAARVAVVVSGWADPPPADPPPTDPSGAHPSGAHPSGAHPSGAHPSGAHPSSAEPDDAQQQALVARGWVLLHATWRDLVERPHVVLAEIARHVAHGLAELGRAC